MKVDLIHQVIDHYVETRSLSEVQHLIDSVQQFQNNWDPVALDYGHMFDSSLNDNFISTFWKNRPKVIKQPILRMIERNREAVQQMFQDLMYPRVALASRVEHFIEDCDTLFKPLFNTVGLGLKGHGHDDLEVIFMYLSFHRPSKIPLYRYSSLISFLGKIMARNIPGPTSFDDQLKAHKILSTFLDKNDNYQEWKRGLDLVEGKDMAFVLASDVIYSSFNS